MRKTLSPAAFQIKAVDVIRSRTTGRNPSGPLSVADLADEVGVLPGTITRQLAQGLVRSSSFAQMTAGSWSRRGKKMAPTP